MKCAAHSESILTSGRVLYFWQLKFIKRVLLRKLWFLKFRFNFSLTSAVHINRWRVCGSCRSARRAASGLRRCASADRSPRAETPGCRRSWCHRRNSLQLNRASYDMVNRTEGDVIIRTWCDVKNSNTSRTHIKLSCHTSTYACYEHQTG